MRSRRILFGADVLVSAVLAAALLVILNFLAARYDRSFDWTEQRFHSLDAKTANLLKGVTDRKEKVKIATFFALHHNSQPYELELYDRVLRLLDRYKAACPSLEILHVDLYQEPDRAKALSQEVLGGPPEPNSVAFRCGDRHKAVSAEQMAVLGGQPVGVREFKAEDAFSTALSTVLLSRQPSILYATGHGERSVASDQPERPGLEFLKELMERQGLVLKPGPLGTESLEGRADLVIVAGPLSPWLPHEADLLHNYLLHGGRLLMLMDPMPGPGNKGLAPTGLEALVARWGVTARDELVIDPKQCAGLDEQGRPRTEAFRTTAFSPDSQITRGMDAQTPMVFMEARPVEPTPGGAPPGIQVRSVVRSESSSWAKHDLRDLARGPLKSDPRLDRAGPHVLGVQLEVLPVHEALPTASSDAPPPLPPDTQPGGRALVLGDADLASNQVLFQSKANQDFLLNAVYWLLNREDSMGISAKSDVIHVVLYPDQRRQVEELIQWLPGLLCLLTGVLVWWLRSR